MRGDNHAHQEAPTCSPPAQRPADLRTHVSHPSRISAADASRTMAGPVNRSAVGGSRSSVGAGDSLSSWGLIAQGQVVVINEQPVLALVRSMPTLWLSRPTAIRLGHHDDSGVLVGNAGWLHPVDPRVIRYTYLPGLTTGAAMLSPYSLSVAGRGSRIHPVDGAAGCPAEDPIAGYRGLRLPADTCARSPHDDDCLPRA